MAAAYSVIAEAARAASKELRLLREVVLEKSSAAKAVRSSSQAPRAKKVARGVMYKKR